ncbi:MAG: hypothetical protein Q8R37_02560 [Nanoarchaeota archaeon]|nr:hypothetical protein [Nanoarchaeota archaeon]
MKDKDFLEKIAMEMREEFETKTIDVKLLEQFFYDYIPLNHCESFIQKSLESFPRNNCSVATVYLKHKIPEGKVIPGWYGLDVHVFLMVDDIIVDITADQFGGPKVYVGPLKYPWGT